MSQDMMAKKHETEKYIYASSFPLPHILADFYQFVAHFLIFLDHLGDTLKGLSGLAIWYGKTRMRLPSG